MSKTSHQNLQCATLLQQAGASFQARRFMQAQNLCAKVLAVDKNNLDAIEILAGIELANANYFGTVDLLRRCAALKPREPKYAVMLGNVLSTAARFDEAQPWFEKALRLQPRFAMARSGLAHTFVQQGRHAEALALLEPVVLNGADDAETARVYGLAMSGLDRHAEAVATLERHVHAGAATGGLLFVLGRMLERLGQLDRAFAAYQQARQSSPLTFDVDEFRKLMSDLREVFSVARLQHMPRAAGQSDRLIFVTGRPRSGTTLVSRIIAAHPQTFDAGELPTIHELTRTMNLRIGSTLTYPHCVLDLEQNDVDRLAAMYFDQLPPAAKKTAADVRVLDKNLSTWMALGLIEILFPHAKIIHTIRDPLDVCFACWSEHLGAAHPYAGDLRTIGLTYRLYESLMQHWRKVLTIPILDVRYEELVNDQEQVTRRMIEFLGLDWNDRCLRFYERSESSRSAAAVTLSHDQVRKPMYRSSLNRAEKFRSHLGPLIEALAEGETKYGDARH